MKKEKRYELVRFSADALREVYGKFDEHSKGNEDCERINLRSVDFGDETWYHDSPEEFLVDYRKSSGQAYWHEDCKISCQFELQIVVGEHQLGLRTLVGVNGPSREAIESIFDIFESYAEECAIERETLTKKPNVFLGHGRSQQWRDLKDHLQDQHNYEVIAYETGARAGHAVRDILEEMLKTSDFALLVMTGEDETSALDLNPRMNVVHELGLFQGRLGFHRAIVLLEKGTKEFTNINGVHQIRYAKGNIKETFGDVLATLRREFPMEFVD